VHCQEHNDEQYIARMTQDDWSALLYRSGTAPDVRLPTCYGSRHSSWIHIVSIDPLYPQIQP